MSHSDARQDLYAAFRQYPLQATIDGCPHCELGEAESYLHARPLEEMTWHDFGVYLFKAMTTFGEVEDFKHFLPRLFELYFLDHGGAPYSLFILFNKLNHADWTSWPQAEIASIQKYIQSWIDDLEGQDPHSSEPDWELEEIRSLLAKPEFEAMGAA
jgi:hypothetical protein